jgi:hypothetical protein
MEVIYVHSLLISALMLFKNVDTNKQAVVASTMACGHEGNCEVVVGDGHISGG